MTYIPVGHPFGASFAIAPPFKFAPGEFVEPSYYVGGSKYSHALKTK